MFEDMRYREKVGLMEESSNRMANNKLSLLSL